MPLEHPPVLRASRLDLEPLRVEHAQEMAPLLEDAGLHLYVGGQPATPAHWVARRR